jgi:ornithine cyclodeaminase/alanine dehydrogenase-like protein (mu-crystallin family)
MDRDKRELLYLSHEDVLACGLTPGDITAAVRRIFLAKAHGTAHTAHKLFLTVDEAVSFSGKGGVDIDSGFAVVKWYGYVPRNAQRGVPDFNPTLILSSIESGLPVAIIDGHWLSALRTASITCVAAGLLADPAATTIGFIACGMQASAHLDALKDLFGIRRITAFSKRRQSAERFAEAARRHGLHADVTDDPRRAVEGQDIVVSSIPLGSDRTKFLDAHWIRPGGFASMVDLGYAWDRESLRALDVVVTDELDPATRRPTEALNYDGAYTAELSELVAGRTMSAMAPTSRKALIFGGTGLADAAAAVAVYRRAVERRIGRLLPM